MSCLGKSKFELDTPCLTIDLATLKHNLKLMQNFSNSHKIGLRPHCKTHKCSTLARMQMENGAIGLSTAKISEAETLIANGLHDILITSPIVSAIKLNRFEACFNKSPSLMVVVDNFDNVLKLNEIGCHNDKKVNVLIDIDSGIGRTGINPAVALEFATSIKDLPGINLKGIQCYAGNLQHIHSYNERKTKSLSVMQSASTIVRLLKKHGIPCHILTGTGTGTYDIDVQDTLVTEIQPGSYTVMDVEYSAIESVAGTGFNTFGVAMTLLTTVISDNRKEHVTVDAGTKGIYFDKNTKPKIISHPGLHYDWNGFGDEHGKVTATHGELPSVGTVLELIIPHCDPTINLYDYFFIMEQGVVVDVWPIDLRGKSQ